MPESLSIIARMELEGLARRMSDKDFRDLLIWLCKTRSDNIEKATPPEERSVQQRDYLEYLFQVESEVRTFL